MLSIMELADMAALSRRINGENDPREAVRRVFSRENIPVIHEKGSRYRQVLSELGRRGLTVLKKKQMSEMFPVELTEEFDSRSGQMLSNIPHEKIYGKWKPIKRKMVTGYLFDISLPHYKA